MFPRRRWEKRYIGSSDFDFELAAGSPGRVRSMGVVLASAAAAGVRDVVTCWKNSKPNWKIHAVATVITVCLAWCML